LRKGIVLVANLNSQQYCENLVYSIRKCGCKLPIRLIHFGGKKINSKFLLNEVEFLTYDDFSDEAHSFIKKLSVVLTDCPMGFLYRFLAWFTDWDQFIYSDNDIVALMNWQHLFDYAKDVDLVHADEEYTTKGKFNYNYPKLVDNIFGENSLKTAITAGHILINKREKMIKDMLAAVDWFIENPTIPKYHDQSLLHISSLIGDWKLLNLCKGPYNWLSSWSGDYTNSLDLIHAIQGVNFQSKQSNNPQLSHISFEDKTLHQSNNSIKKCNQKISHLHYSGRGRIGMMAIDDLMLSKRSDKQRMMFLFKTKITDLFLINLAKDFTKKIKRKLNFYK
tara:strand:+ start:322 stop:1326 length:1005 start_codon:yes stop_codon:yes gene_type:complete